MEGPPVSI